MGRVNINSLWAGLGLVIMMASIEAAEPTTMSRAKRTVPFLTGSGTGYIVAVALPIGNGPRHAFNAFNFELHFSLADNNTFSPTGLIDRFHGKRSIEDGTDLNTGSPAKTSQKSGCKKKNMFTRKHVYRVIENHLFRSGYNGTACLLKTICNTAESDLYENNGVFGNVFHIVFTPSSSKDEHIPQFFYDAEQMGKFGQCGHFDTDCPRSLLEYVSQSFDEVLNKIR